MRLVLKPARGDKVSGSNGVGMATIPNAVMEGISITSAQRALVGDKVPSGGSTGEGPDRTA